jgi:hypothetical protein
MIARSLALVLLVATLGVAAQCQSAAQDSPPTPADGGQGRRGGWAGMGAGRGVLGTVTEAAADHYTIKTESGDIYTIHFSANTRIIKAPERRRGQGDDAGTPPQQLKPADIKVGDAITVGGEVDAAAKSVGAVFIALIDPERAKQMQEMEANFGKTWLMGKVTAIDGVKVTIQGGPGNASHAFVADDNTTFRKHREPITLGDVQVGDAIRVEGAVKNGAFVAATVAVMTPPSTASAQPH